MSDDVKAPTDCKSMADVRRGVDATDRALLDLLDRRFGYMKAAARIKTDRASVRDEQRKATVIAAARRDAQARSLPANDIEQFWELLVESSIAFEFEEWDRIRT